MASGLIYLIIIGMWVAYFLPRWMRQHETLSGRAGERYKSAMKIVASTPNFPDPVNLEERSKCLRIRRLALTTLTILLLGTGGLSLAGLVPFVAIFIPLTAVTIYLVHVRRQVVATQMKRRRLTALAAITAVEIKDDPVALIDLSRRGRRQSDLVVEQWVPLIEKHEERSWSPIAVPRPSYATAPKAIKSKRTIDLTTPGKWSAEQERRSALEIPERDELFDQELVEQAAAKGDWAANQ
jgi:hypothetical protein